MTNSGVSEWNNMRRAIPGLNILANIFRRELELVPITMASGRTFFG